MFSFSILYNYYIYIGPLICRMRMRKKEIVSPMLRDHNSQTAEVSAQFWLWLITARNAATTPTVLSWCHLLFDWYLQPPPTQPVVTHCNTNSIWDNTTLCLIDTSRHCLPNICWHVAIPRTACIKCWQYLSQGLCLINTFNRSIFALICFLYI